MAAGRPVGTTLALIAPMNTPTERFMIRDTAAQDRPLTAPPAWRRRLPLALGGLVLAGGGGPARPAGPRPPAAQSPGGAAPPPLAPAQPRRPARAGAPP